MNSEDDTNIYPCNLLPGHSKCGVKISKGNCPGLGEIKCLAKQKRPNASPEQAITWMKAYKDKSSGFFVSG